MLSATLTFQPNERGGDPVAFIEHVPVFPGEGHKGRVKPNETWECQLVFVSPSVVMAAPKNFLVEPEASQVGRIYHTTQTCKQAVTLADACKIMGYAPRPKLRSLA